MKRQADITDLRMEVQAVKAEASKQTSEGTVVSGSVLPDVQADRLDVLEERLGILETVRRIDAEHGPSRQPADSSLLWEQVRALTSKTDMLEPQLEDLRNA